MYATARLTVSFRVVASVATSLLVAAATGESPADQKSLEFFESPSARC